MDITKSSKKFIDNVEDKVEKGLEVAKDALSNVARHLPFANLARHSKDTVDIEVDLPGVKKEDINIEVEGRYLTVSAERKMKNEVKEEDYYLYESRIGLFSRSFLLPENIDTEKIDAKYEDGRLYIKLEKEESKKPKSISVK